ncbi:histidine phosphatase superfamily [Kockovaella imperatae]|uniref:Histidine phosphatase superfamily n=1 Tax=Kockovaella imperatae TaxID=4999 RepID=A0A1Y1UGF9_9TREE|nr:histidine phosphatase superfamily [Kockovaella imperatae]ORX36155.1 histidine phosphatase superfamily [Kockovaella imperatae]
MISQSSLATLCLLALVHALPSQRPFEASNSKIVNEIEPLKHLSAISPFYVPTSEPDPLPQGCSLETVSVLIRHSAILGNDEEYEQTMGPFIEKLAKFDKEKLPRLGEWSFLRDWKSPLKEDELDELSERGKRDSKFLGKYFRKQYGSLFPDPKKHKGKGKPSYKVWTASSQRDIDSARSYILGSFPAHQSGGKGEGDGDVVQLIKVPNKAKDWDRSLTPHKACDTFEKQSSLKPANQWLKVYAKGIKERLHSEIPHFARELSDQDILAMQMLCGYESIATGSSPFCHVFTDSEWRDVEYYFDIRWYHAIGYGSHLSPYLGLPWVKTAAHLLEGKDADDSGHESVMFNGGSWMLSKSKLPGPRLPPNATHSQLLHPSFTHRESPAFVAVFLNLYNSSSLAHPASEPLPLDHRVDDRAWRSSHLISFLGHVALERFKCTGTEDTKPHGLLEEDYLIRPGSPSHSFVRAVVNGKAETMTGCEDGPEGSCRWKTFRKFVDDRVERWGDWESVCDKK